MKKTTLLLIGCLFLFAASHAQPLSFIQNNQILDNNAEITVTEINRGKMNAHILIKNNTLLPVNAALTITVLEEPIGGEVGYCGWGFSSCMPVKYGAPQSSTHLINGGAEIDPNVDAMDVDETNTLIKIEYKLAYGENESKVYVSYKAGTASAPSHGLDKFITFSQSGSTLEVTYNFDAAGSRKFIIYDITGKLKSSENIQGSSGTFAVANLAKGIYLYSIHENDKPIGTYKLIIR